MPASEAGGSAGVMRGLYWTRGSGARAVEDRRTEGRFLAAVRVPAFRRCSPIRLKVKPQVRDGLVGYYEPGSAVRCQQHVCGHCAGPGPFVPARGGQRSWARRGRIVPNIGPTALS